MRPEVNRLYRFCVASAAIVAPLMLLIRGFFGSFIFSFSVPLIWQVAYLGKSVASLGLTRKSLGVSILTGIASGCCLGLLAGAALQVFGLTGFSPADMHNMQLVIAGFKFKLPLVRELGRQLLANSNSVKGLLLYLAFAIGVIGLGEEIFWRGFIQRKIANRVKKQAAIYLKAVLFALVHSYIFIIVPAQKGIIFLALIAVAGVIWGYVYERLDNIWSVALSHGIVAFMVWKYYFFAGLTQ